MKDNKIMKVKIKKNVFKDYFRINSRGDKLVSAG